MKILISGGAGFIGRKLCKKLNESHDIIVLDNFLEQIHGSDSYDEIPNVKYIKGDVSNYSDWELALNERPDCIIHLAAETGTGQSMEEIVRYVNTNIIGTSILLELLNKKDYGVKKIVLSSTRAVYGDNLNSSDNLILDPKSVYGVTKLTQENLLKASCKIPYTILRYQNVFGDGQSLNNPYTGIISIFSNLLIKNESVNIFDNGLPSRDFIYVDDIVNATSMCMWNNQTDFQTYDVGTGESHKILDITEKLKGLLGSKSEIKISDYHREGDILHAVADINKITEQTDWKLMYSIDQGLTNFVNWFLAKKNKL
jgi:dTDP-L-rhamnose 4-epimerase